MVKRISARKVPISNHDKTLGGEMKEKQGVSLLSLVIFKINQIFPLNTAQVSLCYWKGKRYAEPFAADGGGRRKHICCSYEPAWSLVDWARTPCQHDSYRGSEQTYQRKMWLNKQSGPPPWWYFSLLDRKSRTELIPTWFFEDDFRRRD